MIKILKCEHGYGSWLCSNQFLTGRYYQKRGYQSDLWLLIQSSLYQTSPCPFHKKVDFFNFLMKGAITCTASPSFFPKFSRGPCHHMLLPAWTLTRRSTNDISLSSWPSMTMLHMHLTIHSWRNSLEPFSLKRWLNGFPWRHLGCKTLAQMTTHIWMLIISWAVAKIHSFFMAIKLHQWNNLLWCGNPTHSSLVNNLVRHVRKQESCEQGKDSQACCDMVPSQFKNVIEITEGDINQQKWCLFFSFKFIWLWGLMMFWRFIWQISVCIQISTLHLWPSFSGPRMSWMSMMATVRLCWGKRSLCWSD